MKKIDQNTLVENILADPTFKNHNKSGEEFAEIVVRDLRKMGVKGGKIELKGFTFFFERKKGGILDFSIETSFEKVWAYTSNWLAIWGIVSGFALMGFLVMQNS
jgi:hypothetical protein